MADEPAIEKLKPVVILPPKSMTKADMQQLREAGICVVECKKPSEVRFLDPPPCGYELRNQAAIKMFLKIVNNEVPSIFTRDDYKKTCFDIMCADLRAKATPAPKAVKGTP